jgi:F-box/leucine-rich repeat protein 2/20
VSDTRLLALSVGAHGKNRVSKVEFVDCPKITDLGFSSLATACKDLRLVSILECVQLSGEAFSAIGECRGLEVLRLSETGVTDSALKRVARGCLLLQELSLSDCEAVGNEGLIYIAGGCKKLKRLELSGKVGLNDAGLRSMEIPTLKHFLLKRMRGVTERGLVSFMQGQSSRKLRTLTLSRSPAATDEALLQVACHCVSLRALTLSRCTRVTNKALEEIAARSVSLQHLTLLSCPGIGDQGLESVLSRSADTLEKLCVSKCKGVRDGHSLALAGPCNSMRVLELSGMPNMTDKCLAAIARACPNLQEVDCSKSAKVRVNYSLSFCLFFPMPRLRVMIEYLAPKSGVFRSADLRAAIAKSCWNLQKVGFSKGAKVR